MTWARNVGARLLFISQVNVNRAIVECVLRGINHITFVVSDLEASLAFYRDLLGCQLRARWARGCYLVAGDTWLCLELSEAPASEARSDHTHIAFDVAPEDFNAFRTRIIEEAELWKANTSEGDSVYFLDPDGHKLEVHVGSLETRLASALDTYDGMVLVDSWQQPSSQEKERD